MIIILRPPLVTERVAIYPIHFQVFILIFIDNFFYTIMVYTVKVEKPLTVQDIMNINRDQYEKTPFDMTAGIDGKLYKSVRIRTKF